MAWSQCKSKLFLTKEYWNPEIETQHSTLNETFLAFVFIMVIVIMAMKVVHT